MPQSLPRPDDPSTRRRAALAGGEPRHVLVAAGAWLREADPEGREEAEAALASMAPDQLAAVVAEADVGGCSEALTRACSEAFEAALEEDEDERAALEEAALASLEERDEVESLLVAAAWVTAQATDVGGASTLAEAVAAVRGALAEVDAEARRRARPLTALNPLRRARAEELAPEHREASWWLTHLADEGYDGLIEGLGGLEAASGEGARAEVERARLPQRTAAFGAALRAAEEARMGDEDPALRWADAEAKRSEGAAIALQLSKDLRVDALDLEAIERDA